MADLITDIPRIVKGNPSRKLPLEPGAGRSSRAVLEIVNPFIHCIQDLASDEDLLEQLYYQFSERTRGKPVLIVKSRHCRFLNSDKETFS